MANNEISDDQISNDPVTDDTVSDQKGSSSGSSRVNAAIAGILAGAVALGIGELVGAFTSPKPGPVVAVANRVIDNAPGWFVEFGKSVFGLSDKVALIVGTVILSLLFGALLGLASRRSLRFGIVGLVGFGILGALAIGSDAQGTWITGLVVSGIAALAGIITLSLLLTKSTSGATAENRAGLALNQPGSQSGSRSHTQSQKDSKFGTAPTALTDLAKPRRSRRSFLGWSAAMGVIAAAAAASAQSIRSRSRTELARGAVQFDSSEDEALAQATAAEARDVVASVPGITPLIVPNDDFYLIDTAIREPLIDTDTWKLEIKGMVDNPVEFSYQDLLDRAETTAPVTLSCVSNEVGGGLVGNAIWRGVPLVDLLNEAGVQPEATQIASRSVDGWSCGFPTEAAFDGRTALLAVGMNGEALPIAHGFPARLVVSGLYGYVSATKWIKEIELTTLEDFDGYWIPRGWSKLGPVKTQSRIDTPSRGTDLVLGEEIAIGGVAWAPNTGIQKVEVQANEGEWREATLGESLGDDAWRQWFIQWTPTEPGRQLLRVRATDETGETQTSTQTPSAPSGATGWHEVAVLVA